MAYQDIVNVNVSLQTTASSRAGFGTQLFIGAHAWFRERVRSYSSLTAAAQDLPTTSNEYKALQAVFAQSPQPQTVKIGRREATTTLTPTGAVDATTYSVRVEVNGGDFVVASYTATVPTDTQETIATALKAAIDGDVDVSAHVTTAVVGTGADAVLTIAATTSTDEYAVSALTELTTTFASTETAADVLAAIKLEDNGFYFVTAHDHTEAFILAMAAAIEAEKKLYFVSSSDENVLAALANPATDTFGKLYDSNYFRTVTLYHQNADTAFPECAFVGRFSPSDPGTVMWTIKTLSGVSKSTALNGGTTATPLSSTQKTNLGNRNANFIDNQRGVDIVYGGKTVGGEWCDIIRSRDYIEDQTEAALFNLKLNQPKIPFDDVGINQIKATVISVWDDLITSEGSPNILDSAKPYKLSFPRAADVSFADKQARTYTASATMYLAGAIFLTELNVDLTYLTE